MQKEFIGKGSLNKIKCIVNEIKPKKILLITGKKSFLSSGASNKINSLLRNFNIIIFNDFQSNPKIEDVKCGIGLFKSYNPDLIIAIGGGSAIDMAKMINILSVQKDSKLTDYIKNPLLIKRRGIPLVAVPTTIGTGSESTQFSVLYVKKVKYSLSHQFMMPDYAIIDAELSFNLPEHIAAASGMDALSQAVESYWAVKSTKESKQYASEAITLALSSLKGAVLGDKKSIEEMSKAAHLSGRAINITTTTAPHALSYPITTYFGLQHGHAVALTLGNFFIINFDVDDDNINDCRGVKYLKKIMRELYNMFGVSSSLECKDKWYAIMKEIGLDSDMEKIGITTKLEMDKIVDNINLQRLKNNPVRVNKRQLYKLLSNNVTC